ncbi:hypothetical protein FIBSPDRAFT_850318 [Athelia psychrophila]|uniref:Jacalin-type lectin domain-containing protein n=1 Tax=Athelia psychrophila TaxID=1759441 RepID=A0A166TBK5_9AGAM|nr:hypothetical protein FIBSPDRAFT_850318 [Fibularhizoctonia sp. CBS 109695]
MVNEFDVSRSTSPIRAIHIRHGSLIDCIQWEYEDGSMSTAYGGTGGRADIFPLYAGMFCRSRTFLSI